MNIREIILATTNPGKLTELRKLLTGWTVAVRGLGDFGPLEKAAESGASFAENARQKAQHYGRLLGGWVLADDSGLHVEALGQAPGVYSARFADTPSPDPVERDRANNRKLLELLAHVPLEKRSARFCCCLCLCYAAQVVREVEGFLEGVIISEPHGSNGFGYDPVFFLPHLNKTVAQLSPDQKNTLSHRGQALRNLLTYLEPFLERNNQA